MWGIQRAPGIDSMQVRGMTGCPNVVARVMNDYSTASD